MKKKIELPLLEPKFSTYHGQAALGGMLAKNPSIWNWQLNESVMLICERDFLFGDSSLRIGIKNTDPLECPYIDKRTLFMQFTKGYINHIIRILIDNNYYAFFYGIDDYYMEGKTWYKKRHFANDGLICGYDMEEKTYTVFAYDKDWKLKKFKVPMECFEAGRKSMFKKGIYGILYALSPQKDTVQFSTETVYTRLTEYLDSSMEKYPLSEEGTVLGIAVHNYIVKYLEMLMDGTITCDKIDRGIFQLIEEHKKVMWERLHMAEHFLDLDNETSNAYERIVTDAGKMRSLYSLINANNKNYLLSSIKKILIDINQLERQLLGEFLKKMEDKTQQ